jgi:hypothetical protein
MKDGSPFAMFMDKTDEAFSKGYGFQFRVANVLEEILAKIGFVNIRCARFKAPIGRWPRVGCNLEYLAWQKSYTCIEQETETCW